MSAAALYKTDPGATAPFSPLPRVFGGKHADVRTLHGSARRLRADSARRRRREGTTERNERRRRRQIEFTEPFPPVVRLRHVQQPTGAEVMVVVPPPRGEGAPSGTILYNIIHCVYTATAARRLNTTPVVAGIYLSYIIYIFIVYHVHSHSKFEIVIIIIITKRSSAPRHLVNVRARVTRTPHDIILIYNNIYNVL